MIVIGLTGGLAMGKTTVAKQFAFHGAAVFDADCCVHQLLGSKGGAVKDVAELFPQAKGGDCINRKILGKIVFEDPKKLQQLEFILHPKVREEETLFLRKEQMQRRRVVVMDIPLLFETGADRLCDVTVAVFCPEWMQWQRAKKREHMNEEKFRRICSSQMTAQERNSRADKVIPTSLGKNHSMQLVKTLLLSL